MTLHPQTNFSVQYISLSPNSTKWLGPRPQPLPQPGIGRRGGRRTGLPPGPVLKMCEIQLSEEKATSPSVLQFSEQEKMRKKWSPIMGSRFSGSQCWKPPPSPSSLSEASMENIILPSDKHWKIPSSRPRKGRWGAKYSADRNLDLNFETPIVQWESRADPH